MMKKVLALILALVMVFAMSSVSFAAIDAAEGANTQDVFINVEKTKTYSVTIDWGTYEFTYEYGDWNESKHDYDVKGWAGVNEGNPKTTFTVTNNSNVSITVEAAYAKKSAGLNAALTNVDAQFNGATTVVLPSAVGAEANDLIATFELEITGTPADVANAAVDGATLGTVTITITPGT